MAENVLQRAHSYTLIKPGSSRKVIVRRGQTIDNLDVADQQYLSRKTISPPSTDDSHAPVGRVPLFGPLVDADVRGEAAVEPVVDTVAESMQSAASATSEPVTVRVEVSATEGLDANVLTTTDGAAAGGADSGGDTAAVEATSTTRTEDTARKTRKPSAKKQ